MGVGQGQEGLPHGDGAYRKREDLYPAQRVTPFLGTWGREQGL